MSGTIQLYHNDQLVFNCNFFRPCERKEIMERKAREFAIKRVGNFYWQIMYVESITKIYRHIETGDIFFSLLEVSENENIPYWKTEKRNRYKIEFNYEILKIA